MAALGHHAYVYNMSAKFFIYFSIYLKASQSFCSIRVSQYSQENTCARASFFINSLQLQGTP